MFDRYNFKLYEISIRAQKGMRSNFTKKMRNFYRIRQTTNFKPIFKIQDGKLLYAVSQAFLPDSGFYNDREPI